MLPSPPASSGATSSVTSSGATSSMTSSGPGGDDDTTDVAHTEQPSTGSGNMERSSHVSFATAGDCGDKAVECADEADTEMQKSEGMEGVGGGVRQRHNTPLDSGSAADSSMKHGQMSPTNFPTTPDKTMSHVGTPEPSVSNSSIKHSKRESYKAQKRTYRSQKKEAAKELLSTITDPAVVLLGDWLKVRGTLKSWTKLWCVLKPGVLILYKSDKHKGSQWVGTILLNTCQLLERPSKKDGFCFKLFHPLDQSIWATKGPKGEQIGAFVQPLPYSYCIFRAPSESAGKCWMDALELALKCTNLLKRSMTRLDNTADTADTAADLDLIERSRNQDAPWRPPSQGEDEHVSHNGSDHLHDVEGEVFSHSFNSMRAQERSMNESDLERHFANQGLDDDKSDREDTELSSQSDFEDDVVTGEAVIAPPDETNYILQSKEEMGQSGDECQTEEVTDENKSLIWTLVKQVRPGMDLSKVVLPTFILEPRSFLDKLSDYYYHANILTQAVVEESPYSRIKSVVRWYLSGFYKKPKGLKKPYNPVIGEAFRCCWRHPETGARTFYIAEQVSHHPPISVFHVTNRKDGFNISGSILARSKFYGNSLSALLEGVATLTFLERGEDYYITMPYAHCKGILIGTLTMELGGKVTIDCPKTGYKCEMDFKLKPFLGSGQASNRIHGKIMMGSDVLSVIDGHWDQEIYIKDRTLDKKREVFWSPTPDIRAGRLKRYTVPLTDQFPHESERLWSKVSKAVVAGDMQTATDEKYVVEEEQRKQTRERKQSNVEWMPRYFEKDHLNGGWIYKYADDRPWDAVNDVYQYEKQFVVQTQTRHKTPHVRAMSLTSLNKSVEKKKLRIPRTVEESDSSGQGHRRESDSSDYVGQRSSGKTIKLTQEGMMLLFDPLIKMQEETTQALRSLQQQVVRLELQHANSAGGGGGQGLLSKDWVTLAIILMFQIVLQWIFR
ncbi:oxysterol-binding protein-related protein 8-like isoform X4 [Littorina saxatilis]|uniref:oxysterol-binding protein-related protein 8-like isoform X4 n=1 Tax=Littorina saxatilis TaxID=31220 RepID=UPI0038B5EF26